jgi:hypothetical protein
MRRVRRIRVPRRPPRNPPPPRLKAQRPSKKRRWRKRERWATPSPNLEPSTSSSLSPTSLPLSNVLLSLSLSLCVCVCIGSSQFLQDVGKEVKGNAWICFFWLILWLTFLTIVRIFLSCLPFSPETNGGLWFRFVLEWNQWSCSEKMLF